MSAGNGHKNGANGKANGAKSTEYSTDTVPVGALINQPHGGAIRNGGTNKGGPGRPPDQWKRWCRQAVSKKEIREKAIAVLQDIESPHWFNALKWLGEQGYGKAAQPIENSGESVLTVRIVRE